MKRFAYFMGIICGIFSIFQSFMISGLSVGGYEKSAIYGGDAFTGIQNASAQAANNLVCLSEITRSGFSALLLVIGVALICGFLAKFIEEGRRKKEAKKAKNAEFSSVANQNPEQVVQQMPNNVGNINQSY